MASDHISWLRRTNVPLALKRLMLDRRTLLPGILAGVVLSVGALETVTDVSTVSVGQNFRADSIGLTVCFVPNSTAEKESGMHGCSELRNTIIIDDEFVEKLQLASADHLLLIYQTIVAVAVIQLMLAAIFILV